MAPIFNIAIFFAYFLGALIFVRNFKMLKFLYILEEQTQKKKIGCQKTKFKLAAKFKMAAKTNFFFVENRWFVVFTSKFSFGSHLEFSGHFEFFFGTTIYLFIFLFEISYENESS
jgi:hypothetical protein